MNRYYEVFVRHFNKDEIEQFLNSKEVRTGENCFTCFSLMRVEEVEDGFDVYVGITRSHAYSAKIEGLKRVGGFKSIGWSKLDSTTWRS